MDYAAFITPALVHDTHSNRLGSWSISPGQSETLSFTLQADKLQAISAIRITKAKGNGTATCSNVKLIADGTVLTGNPAIVSLGNDKGSIVCPIALPDDLRGNNGVELQIKIKNDGTESISGHIYIVTE